MDPLGALSSLGDATRRRIYDHVSARTAPVSREEVAAAAAVGRTLAAYHLDRLAAEGLLTVTHERRSGRSGPGAGRPAKLYARSEEEVSVSVPPRDYHLAARLLADAAAADTEGHTRRALTAAAEQLGRELAADDLALEPLLRERGYEPYDDDGVVRLRNCPFHAVAQRHPEVVCDMNLALLGGLVESTPGVTATLEPAPGRCCVALRRVSG
jgi:predicted ArsR family transcriptional regulator